MSNTEPGQNTFSRASSHQAALRPLSFGKIAGIFLVLGPPLFGALFWLAVSLANPVGDPLHEKIGEALGIALSFFGLLASYVVGLVPSLIVAFVCSRSRRRISSVCPPASCRSTDRSRGLFRSFRGVYDRTERWPATRLLTIHGLCGRFRCNLCVRLCVHSRRVCRRSCTSTLTLRSRQSISS